MTDLQHPHVLQVLPLDQEESTLPVLERMDKSLDLGLDTHLPLISVSFGHLAPFVPLYRSVFVCVCVTYNVCSYFHPKHSTL